jgi:DNA gyrase/topoisomerase IV subunit A
MKLATAFDQELFGNKLNVVIESTLPDITFPIISKGSDWVRVNDILIREADDEFTVSRKGIEITRFVKRAWAIAYAVALCQSNFHICLALKNNNVRLKKYAEEITRYQYHLEQAIARGDIYKENVMSDRLSRTIREYDLILDEVSPLIKSQSDV